jgi:hypothetical protein
MKSRNVLGLVIVAVILMALAYLLSRGSSETGSAADGIQRKAQTQKRERVVYPRDKKPAGEGALAGDRETAAKKRSDLDAMQRALLGPGKKGAIFMEANAIRHAPLMEKILRCREQDSADGLERLKAELGIDASRDLDRIGFDGDVFIASGFFESLKVPPELGEGAAYGDAGRLWKETSDAGEEIVVGRLGDGMLLTGREPDVKAAIDRAEGRAESSGADELPPGFGQGEIYGTVGAAFLQSILGDSEDPIAQSVLRLVTSSTVRMSVDEDAALSLDMQAVDDKSAQDLANMVRGGLALLRSEAQSAGDEELAWLLEQARIQPREGGRFDIDLAVPGEVLLRGMGCHPDGTPLPAPPPRVPTEGPAPAGG